MKAMLDASIVAASTHLPINPCHPRLKRFVDRGALLGEKLRPIGCDVQTVFEANTEFTIDHNRRLITKTHTGLNRRLVAAHEVGPFMTIETNPVTGAVR